MPQCFCPINNCSRDIIIIKITLGPKTTTDACMDLLRKRSFLDVTGMALSYSLVLEFTTIYILNVLQKKYICIINFKNYDHTNTLCIDNNLFKLNNTIKSSYIKTYKYLSFSYKFFAVWPFLIFLTNYNLQIYILFIFLILIIYTIPDIYYSCSINLINISPAASNVILNLLYLQ